MCTDADCLVDKWPWFTFLLYGALMRLYCGARFDEKGEWSDDRPPVAYSGELSHRRRSFASYHDFDCLRVASRSKELPKCASERKSAT